MKVEMESKDNYSNDLANKIIELTKEVDAIMEKKGINSKRFKYSSCAEEYTYDDEKYGEIVYLIDKFYYDVYNEIIAKRNIVSDNIINSIKEKGLSSETFNDLFKTNCDENKEFFDEPSNVIFYKLLALWSTSDKQEYTPEFYYLIERFEPNKYLYGRSINSIGNSQLSAIYNEYNLDEIEKDFKEYILNVLNNVIEVLNNKLANCSSDESDTIKHAIKIMQGCIYRIDYLLEDAEDMFGESLTKESDKDYPLYFGLIGNNAHLNLTLSEINYILADLPREEREYYNQLLSEHLNKANIGQK